MKKTLQSTILGLTLFFSFCLSADAQGKKTLNSSQLIDKNWSYDFSRFTLKQACDFISDLQQRMGHKLSFQFDDSAKTLQHQPAAFKLKREPLRKGLTECCHRLGLIFWEKGSVIRFERQPGVGKPQAKVTKKPGKSERELWGLNTKSPSYGSAAAADIDGDGRLEIVFGTYYNDAQVYAVNAEDGSVLWKRASKGGPLDASVAIADVNKDGQLDVLTADSATGHLFCLHGKTGAVQWTVKLPSGTDSPPAVADLDGDGVLEIVVGTMWTRDRQGRVVVLRADNQKILWQSKVPGCVQSEPVLVDLNGDQVLDVIVSSWRGDRSVRALSGKDGSRLWSYTTDGDKRSSGMYHGVALARVGKRWLVLASTCDGQSIALDSQGQVLWKHSYGQRLFAPPCVADLDNDGEEELIQCTQNKLWCLSVKTGKVLRTRALPGSSARGPALADINGDGQLDLILGAGRVLLAIQGASFKTLWQTEIKVGSSPYEGIDHAPLVADFTGQGQLQVFVVTGKGHSGATQKQNYGRAMLLKAGRGKSAWLTFRGGLKRRGRAPK